LVITDVIKDKNKVMNKILSIPDIFTYIHNTDLTDASQMKDVNIFSRIRVPGTVTTVKNYICFKYSSKVDSYNKSFKNVYITFLVVSDEADIKTSYGNRHDVLSSIIINEFSWSDFLGFTLELTSDTEESQGNYNTRTLTFTNTATNSLNSGVRA
jgi:hypothetical protein